jgi:hypothetical protein
MFGAMADSAIAERLDVKGVSVAEAAALDRLAEQLALDFPDAAAAEIVRAVREEHGRFAGSSVRDFVPILVERSARRVLGNRPHPRARAG